MRMVVSKKHIQSTKEISGAPLKLLFISKSYGALPILKGDSIPTTFIRRIHALGHIRN